MDDWFTTIARDGNDDNFVPPENWSNLIKTSLIDVLAEWATEVDGHYPVLATKWLSDVEIIGPMPTQQQEHDDNKDDDSVLNDVLPAPEGVESIEPVNIPGVMPERQYPAQALQNNHVVCLGLEDNPYGSVSLKDVMVADHDANYLADLPMYRDMRAV
eukprot:5809484-Ditylum_brightwellii.AAC.1